jgi:hypothetical protein
MNVKTLKELANQQLPEFLVLLNQWINEKKTRGERPLLCSSNHPALSYHRSITPDMDILRSICSVDRGFQKKIISPLYSVFRPYPSISLKSLLYPHYDDVLDSWGWTVDQFHKSAVSDIFKQVKWKFTQPTRLHGLPDNWYEYPDDKDDMIMRALKQDEQLRNKITIELMYVQKFIIEKLSEYFHTELFLPHQQIETLKLKAAQFLLGQYGWRYEEYHKKSFTEEV